MRSIWIAIALAACHHAEPVSFDVGLRSLDSIDPITHATLPAIVLYPTRDASAGTDLGPYHVAATRGAAIADGTFPLVAISHGHAGSMLGHHDLAEALARHGYMVIAVEHVGDSYRDQSAGRSDRVLYGRPYQVSAAIDAVLADAELARHVDADRIGVAGFSMGGYTALALIGAHADPSLAAPYCARHPSDADMCGGPITTTMTSPRSPADPRVRAAFVMAPMAILFGPDAYAGVTAPVFLAWATGDHVLVPDENAEHVARDLHSIAGTRRIDADHFVFVAPCGPQLTAAEPAICRDAPGVDRAAIHAQLISDAEAFFDRSLR